MKLTLEPTPEIREIDGSPARAWRGHDEAGTLVVAYIRTIVPCTHDAGRLKAFETALQELPPPQVVYPALNLRQVL